MESYWLTFVLLSDATFGRGDGVAGLVDREVEHDEYGLPFLRGRTLKGLLSEEADNVLFALRLMTGGALPLGWASSRHALFGSPGSRLGDGAVLHVGHAQLPDDLRRAVAQAGLRRETVLGSLTAIRRQTAVGGDGVPEDATLRAMRVILRETSFEACLLSDRPLTPPERGLLAAATLGLRRAGTGRNRGRGRLHTDLLDANRQSILQASFEQFRKEAWG